uniref:LNR domain-containing protein n=1 Tax=Wuchereria bancrofti TaxID=6293 RepID=A0AAF5Q729_WUCBA
MTKKVSGKLLIAPCKTTGITIQNIEFKANLINKLRCSIGGRQTLPSGENLLVLYTIHNISFSISSTFYPQLIVLSCIRSCNREFMDDSWCDFQNNRSYRDWDGGDCCASTVRGRRVRLMFPSLCTSILWHLIMIPVDGIIPSLNRCRLNACPDTSTISLADAAFLLQNDIYIYIYIWIESEIQIGINK